MIVFEEMIRLKTLDWFLSVGKLVCEVVFDSLSDLLALKLLVRF